MSYRNRGAKPTVILWFLVALGNVALIMASAGLVALIALSSVVAVVVGGAMLLRRASESVPVRAPMQARRRA